MPENQSRVDNEAQRNFEIQNQSTEGYISNKLGIIAIVVMISHKGIIYITKTTRQSSSKLNPITRGTERGLSSSAQRQIYVK